jgi:AcrR family transcriptional regulator
MKHRSMAERKRQLVRDELGETALRMFAFQGFENTTIDEIAAAAGVSRRTFFRYFKSKEDVIVEVVGDTGEYIKEVLAGRPDGEPPLVALRHALDTANAAIVEHPEKSIALIRLMMNSPPLKARFLERMDGLARELLPLLAARAGRPPDDLRSCVLAVTALQLNSLVLIRWAEQDGAPDPAALLDEVFAEAAAALT